MAKAKKGSSLRVQLITLADYFITAEDKKMSIIGIFDKIFVKELPANHRQMWLVMTLAGEVGQKETVTLRMISPSGVEELKTDMDITISENQKANVTVNFEGFPIKETGTYIISITNQDEIIGSFPFDAILVKEPAQGEKKIAN